MTPELLKKLRAAGEMATKGPWSVAHWDSPREWEAGRRRVDLDEDGSL